MQNHKGLIVLVSAISVLSIFATLCGILSSDEVETAQFISIHGLVIDVYGIGIYKYMSADVAIQGIAQDYITLLVGVPLLIYSLYKSTISEIKGHLILAGVLAYFLVTYLFYMTMGMYNELFLVYSSLIGLSFFALVKVIFSFNLQTINAHIEYNQLLRLTAVFLIINSLLIGFMWLNIIVPPLWNGTIYPESLEHYTTLIVQGFDLGLLLPLAFVSGYLSLKRKNLGYLSTIVYMVFLSVLFTALSSKLVAMKMANLNVLPAIFIIPTLNMFCVILTMVVISRVKEKKMLRS